MISNENYFNYGEWILNKYPTLNNKINELRKNNKSENDTKKLEWICEAIKNFNVNFDTKEEQIQKINTFAKNMDDELNKLLHSVEKSKKDFLKKFGEASESEAIKKEEQKNEIENLFSLDIKKLNCSDETAYFLFVSKFSILKEMFEKQEIYDVSWQNLENEFKELSLNNTNINSDKEQFETLFSLLKEEKQNIKINKR
ncbi:hypothetical protein FQW77_08595 [Campylobacter jejuni]|nr:hypothetical protein [Campylobacter jejuni]